MASDRSPPDEDQVPPAGDRVPPAGDGAPRSVDRAPLTVVVPTRDRPDHLDRCLTHLRTALAAGDEVLVVDSASRTASTGVVGNRHDVRVLRAPRPGASLARNVGWRVAQHDLIAFVDDDVTVTAGWADAIVGPFDDPDVAFATGRVEVPPAQGTVERPVAVKTDREPARLDAATRGVLGGSCNLALRRTALRAVNGFDERLGPGTWFAAAEDMDLYDRLFAAGCTGRYEPAALAYHAQWRTRRELVSLDWGYGKGMGARLARLVRGDRRRAARLAREVLWDGGLRTVVSDLRKGYEFGALTVGVRMLATILGFLAGLALLPERPDAATPTRRGGASR